MQKLQSSNLAPELISLSPRESPQKILLFLYQHHPVLPFIQQFIILPKPTSSWTFQLAIMEYVIVIHHMIAHMIRGVPMNKLVGNCSLNFQFRKTRKVLKFFEILVIDSNFNT